MLTVFLHMTAGAVLGAWLSLHAELPTFVGRVVALAVCMAVLATLGGWLARQTWPAKPGHLRWDGAQWCATGGDCDLRLDRVVVAVDLGTWLLLRLHPVGGGRPLWRVASARTARGAWHGLRLALAAHAGVPRAGNDGEAAR